MKRFAKILCALTALMLLFAMIPAAGLSVYAEEAESTEPNGNISITRVDMTIDEPEIGATPDTTLSAVTVPAGCLTQSEFTVGWLEATRSDLSDANWMSTPTFQPGKIYILDWPRDPYLIHAEVDGYSITANTTLTVNGVQTRLNANYPRVFDRLPSALAEIRMTIDEPVAGHAPDTTLSLETVPAGGFSQDLTVECLRFWKA